MFIGKRLMMLVSLFLVSASASASLLTLSLEGSFSSTTTLGGEELGARTAFNISFVFDSSHDLNEEEDRGLYAATVDFEVDGFGSYRVAADADPQLRINEYFGEEFYFAFLIPGGPGFSFVFDVWYEGPSTDFDVDSPVPTEFSFWAGYALTGERVEIPLEGLGGPLVIDEDLFILSSSAITAVPLPPAIALLFSGLVALLRVSVASSSSRRDRQLV